VQPSAAAAAGAAAAALLQKQLAADGGGDPSLEPGWTEHQTGDGRKFYFHEETQTSSWEKPNVLKTPEERANNTEWREYKIWDGRTFYHNRSTKVSCWSMPPEVRQARGETSGPDGKEVPRTNAEKRRAFVELLEEKGADETWTWLDANHATAGQPAAQSITEAMRKQCFAELLGLKLRQRHIEARKYDRNAASAFERLIEETFSKPDDVDVTYEEAAKKLSGHEAWNLIKSDLRRDEVFQSVMERLEEKHKKTRNENRPASVVRLQRLMASDGELRRARLRWKDVARILSKKDELQDQEQPVEALRAWASLKELKQVSEYEAEAKSRVVSTEAMNAYREERRRRDALVSWLKELAIHGKITVDSPWADFEALADNDPRLVALQEGPGATAMELFDEFQEDLRRDGPELYLGVGSVPILDAAADTAKVAEEPRPRKKQRLFEEPEMNPLDALIAAQASLGEAAAQDPVVSVDDEEDPLMAVVNQAAAEKERKAVAAPGGLSASDAQALMEKKIEELRSMCRDKGLPVSGRKEQLVDRLISA